jgi:hypothetical protein
MHNSHTDYHQQDVTYSDDEDDNDEGDVMEQVGVWGEEDGGAATDHDVINHLIRHKAT